MKDYPIYHLYCCRVWPVVLWAGIGYCGICGQVPQDVLCKEEIDAYYRERQGDSNTELAIPAETAHT